MLVGIILDCLIAIDYSFYLHLLLIVNKQANFYPNFQNYVVNCNQYSLALLLALVWT